MHTRRRIAITSGLSVGGLILGLALILGVSLTGDGAVPDGTFVLVLACAVAGLVPAASDAGEERSLSELADAMRQLGQGKSKVRVETDGVAEHAPLVEAFNDMAGKLTATLAELRDTRDYLEGIVESSADVIVTVNPRGYVYTFNRGAENLLGYGRNEVIGRPVDRLFADPQEQERVARRLRGVENVVNYETRLRTKAGEVRDVALTLSRLHHPDGTTIGSFGIGRDVTDAKLMQERLVYAERFSAIGQAVAGIQHSLKNMLNALKGGAYMVGIGLSKEDRSLLEEGWTMVKEGIDNLTTMSTQMLKYVRNWRPEFEDVDVGNMIREIEAIFRARVAEKGATLGVEVAEDVPHVLCDATLLHSALMDILSNALDACMEKDYAAGEGAAIAVRARRTDTGERVVVAIEDNGCGMPEDVKKSVFTPFFTTKRSLGTGLGLALTARTIRLHGGEIEVESTPGEGSIFRIGLPPAGPNPNKEEASGQEGAGHR